MELSHRFTVPVGVDEAFATFEDVATVAECFPGATVTSVSEQTFEGTAKVKLGPIAMVYSGAGSFLERDPVTRRMVVEAKGRDKRGNGTAGATIRATFTPDGDAATDVEVLTDLQITGKPAQFGRGVIQDVSDKLLGQFVDCLQQRIGSGPAAPDTLAGTAEQPDAAASPVASPVASAAASPADAGTPEAAPAGSADDALDLGATVLPVLARQYGPPLAGVLLVLLLLRWLARRRVRRR